MKDRPKGDLVEQLIFEAFKDKDVRGASYFKDIIKRDYGFKVSSDLYRKIINYQIETYGVTLQNLNQREYVKFFGAKSNAMRNKMKEVIDRREKTKRMIERIYNEKAKRKEVSERKISK